MLRLVHQWLYLDAVGVLFLERCRGVRFSLDDQAKTELAVGLEKLREPSEVDWSGMIEMGTQFLSKWGAE